MKDLSGSNIMITGAAGCIGSYIADYLIDNFCNLRLFCIDNFYNGKIENLEYAIENAKKKNNSLLFYQVDIDDILTINFEYTMDYVFHQASMLTIDSKKDRIKSVKTNVLGFTKICEFSLANKAKLIFASSASVYGNPNIIPTPESHTFANNRLMYGATKIGGEYIANSYADEEGLKIVALRPFNVYGPRQSLSNVYTQVVPKFVNSLLDDKEITIFGNGNQTMDLINAKDVARFYVQLAQIGLYRGKIQPEEIRNFLSDRISFLDEYNKMEPEIRSLFFDKKSFFDGYVNCGTGISTSVYELYIIIKDLLTEMNYSVSEKVRYEQHDPNLVSKRQASVTLSNYLFGRHTIEVKQGIKEMVNYLANRR